MATVTKKILEAYAKKNNIVGLSRPTLVAIIEKKEGYSIAKGKDFLTFQARINKELLKHRIITHNEFTLWFQEGNIELAQIREFVVQFSVFSNLFLIAQLHKTINADTLEGMRASKEILANEIGVIFKPPRRRKLDKDDNSNPSDPELVSTEGTVEGGKFRFQAAHFEWLLTLAEKLGLSFSDIGTRSHGTDSTLFFCDELVRLYGSQDYLTSQAASYAVENWAAAGFWDELIKGFQLFNDKSEQQLPISFFTWHSKIESQHALHTQEELEEIYFARAIDEGTFIKVGNEMLDGVAVFWDGLEKQRKLA